MPLGDFYWCLSGGASSASRASTKSLLLRGIGWERRSIRMEVLLAPVEVGEGY